MLTLIENYCKSFEKTILRKFVQTGFVNKSRKENRVVSVPPLTPLSANFTQINFLVKYGSYFQTISSKPFVAGSNFRVQVGIFKDQSFVPQCKAPRWRMCGFHLQNSWAMRDGPFEFEAFLEASADQADALPKATTLHPDDLSRNAPNPSKMRL